MQNNNDWLGGDARWFTDTPPSNGFARSVIFPADDLMTVVEMGPRGKRRKLDGADQANRGVGEMMFTPAFTSVAYTDEYQAELVAEALARGRYRTIGGSARGRCRRNSSRGSSASWPARRGSSMRPSWWIASRRSRARKRSA